MMNDRREFETEEYLFVDLRPHPRNYQEHPPDQIEHLKESIRENGLYRNIVIARDGTILAGHGVVQAAQEMGYESVPVVRLDIDPNSPQALKVLAGDNEIEHLAMVDDRALTEILREISQTKGLLGTGYDDKMLANLTFVTRPQSEIKDFDAAAHWVGMPEYEPQAAPLKVSVSFRNESDRDSFMQKLGITGINKRQGSGTWTIWWPDKQEEDPSSLLWEG